MNYRYLILLIALVILIVPASADIPSNFHIIKDTIYATGAREATFTAESHVVRNSTGALWTVYLNSSDESAFPDGVTMSLSYSTDDGVTWNEIARSLDPTTIDLPYYAPGIVIDSHDTIHLVYFSSGTGYAMYRNYTMATGWGDEIRVDNDDAPIANYITATVDSQDIIHVIWDAYDLFDDQIFYTNISPFTGIGPIKQLTHFASPEFDGETLNPHMLADSNDIIHIIFGFDVFSEDSAIYYINFSASGWSTLQHMVSAQIPDYQQFRVTAGSQVLGGLGTDALTNTARGRDVARTPDARLWVATKAAGSSGNVPIELSYSANNGSTWTKETVVSDGQTNGYPDLISDTDGNIYVFWAAAGGGTNTTILNIKMRVRDAATDTWGSVEQVTDYGMGTITAFPSCTLNQSDYIHCIFASKNVSPLSPLFPNQIQIGYTYRQAGLTGTWSTPELLTNMTTDKMQYTGSIVADSSDTLHVAWIGDGWATYPFNNSLSVLYRYKPITGGWNGSTPRDGTEIIYGAGNIPALTTGNYPVLALNSSDFLYLAYSVQGTNVYSHTSLLWRNPSTGTWSATRNITPTENQWRNPYPMIGFDRGDNLTIITSNRNPVESPDNYNLDIYTIPISTGVLSDHVFLTSESTSQIDARIINHRYPYDPIYGYSRSNGIPNVGAAWVWTNGSSVWYETTSDLVWPVQYYQHTVIEPAAFVLDSLGTFQLLTIIRPITNEHHLTYYNTSAASNYKINIDNGILLGTNNFYGAGISTDLSDTVHFIYEDRESAGMPIIDHLYYRNLTASGLSAVYQFPDRAASGVIYVDTMPIWSTYPAGNIPVSGMGFIMDNNSASSGPSWGNGNTIEFATYPNMVLTPVGPPVPDCISNTTTVGADTVVTFDVTGTCAWTAPTGVTSVEYLVVGGGGAGGGSNYAGGGGAGGLLNGSLPVTPGTMYNITIGAGAPFANPGYGGIDGQNSSFANITVGDGINAKGGGGTYGDGRDGGSGGGSWGGNIYIIGYGIAGQGNNGGFGDDFGMISVGGGGGGASEVGTDGINGGNGGDGTASSITGSSVYYAGGGGGGSSSGTGTGGLGGGGDGGYGGGDPAGKNATYYGGGGGGSYGAAGGGYGFGGVVILRYTVPYSVPSRNMIYANITEISPYQPVQFTDISQLGGISYLWNFGDGGTSTEQNPLHWYNSTGTFDVSLHVIGIANNSDPAWTDIPIPVGSDTTGLVYLENGILVARNFFDSNIIRSDDYGVTWSDVGSFPSLSMSDRRSIYLGNGKVLVGSYYSSDYGQTFTGGSSPLSDYGVSAFADCGGGIVIAVSYTNGGRSAKIFRSTDYGATPGGWSEVYNATPGVNFENVVYLGDGKLLAAAGGYPHYLFMSDDYGLTWSDEGTRGIQSAPADGLEYLGDGVVLYASNDCYENYTYRSIDYGYTWTAITPDPDECGANFFNMGNNSVVLGSGMSESLLLSNDGGLTWTTPKKDTTLTSMFYEPVYADRAFIVSDWLDSNIHRGQAEFRDIKVGYITVTGEPAPAPAPENPFEGVTAESTAENVAVVIEVGVGVSVLAGVAVIIFNFMVPKG